MREHVIPLLSAAGGTAPLELIAVGERKGPDILSGSVFAQRRGLYLIRDGVLDMLSRLPVPLTLAQRSNLLVPTAWLYERVWRRNSVALLSQNRVDGDDERERLEAWLTPTPGLWLDLASSTGLYGRWLARHIAREQGEVVGLDLAMPMLRDAQRRARAERIQNLSWVRGRAEALPCADESLSGVVCGGSLNEFGDGAAQALREVARALRPDGQAFFMFLLEARGPGRAATRLAEAGGVRFWDQASARALFEEAGLSIERHEAHGMVAFAQLGRR